MDLAIVEPCDGRGRRSPAPPRRRRTRSTTSCASCPTARRSSWSRRATAASWRSGRPFALHAADACRRRISRSWRRRPAAQVHALGARPAEPDRPHPLRHLDRGDALLPQRHLSPRANQRQAARAARGRHRRPSPGARRDAAAGGRRRDAGRHRAAQDRQRGAQAARRDRRRRSSVSLSDTKIRFAFDDVVLTSKLIDGTFPDYERVIPTDNDKVLEVDRASFADAVDRVSTISTEKSRAVKLAVKQGSLTLSATSPENGTRPRSWKSTTTPRRSRSASTRAICSTSPSRSRAKGAVRPGRRRSPTLVRDMADARRSTC